MENVVLSESLNRLIERAFDALFVGTVVEFVDYEPYNGFKEMVDDIVHFDVLKVSTLHCDNTVFGLPLVNQKFRAVHDWMHFVHDLAFDYESELLVEYHQYKFFKRLGASPFDLDILRIETGGQIVYHKRMGCFPENQYNFTVNELKHMGYEL